MSGSWEIEAAVSPASILVEDGSEELLVRVQIVDLENPDPAAAAFIDLPSTQARRIGLEILAAADPGCPAEAGKRVGCDHTSVSRWLHGVTPLTGSLGQREPGDAAVPEFAWRPIVADARRIAGLPKGSPDVGWV